MMFVIDLNMSPQQDNASEPADQQEEHNSQQRYNNEEPVNNEATGTTSKSFAFSFSFP